MSKNNSKTNKYNIYFVKVRIRYVRKMFENKKGYRMYVKKRELIMFIILILYLPITLFIFFFVPVVLEFFFIDWERVVDGMPITGTNIKPGIVVALLRFSSVALGTVFLLLIGNEGAGRGLTGELNPRWKRKYLNLQTFRKLENTI